MKSAMADPLVRKALELFDGSLLNVERLNHKPAPSAEETEREASEKEESE